MKTETLNKLQRYTLYCIMLAEAELEPEKYDGFCEMLYILTPVKTSLIAKFLYNQGDIKLKSLPELNIKKPKISSWEHWPYWYPEKQWDERKNCSKNVSKKLTLMGEQPGPQW